MGSSENQKTWELSIRGVEGSVKIFTEGKQGRKLGLSDGDGWLSLSLRSQRYLQFCALSKQVYGLHPACVSHGSVLPRGLAVRVARCGGSSPNTGPPVASPRSTLRGARNWVGFIRFLYFLNASQSMSYREIFFITVISFSVSSKNGRFQGPILHSWPGPKEGFLQSRWMTEPPRRSSHWRCLILPPPILE